MMPQLKVKAVLFFLIFTSVFYTSIFSQTKNSSEENKILSDTKKSDNSYTDVLYTGFTYDLDAKSSNKGAWAISIGYRRLIEMKNHWGVNILSSLNCFYNGSEDYSRSTEPVPSNGKYVYTRNYFSASFHAAPSYAFSNQFIMYAGLGITFLQSSEFFTPYSYYGIDVTNAWGDMFSKVLGIEFSPSGKFAMNMEYVRTRANNFLSMKAGMRF